MHSHNPHTPTLSHTQPLSHTGWPSFRDEEVVEKYVRVLADGEAVSVDGTHLGRKPPDGHYCINLVSVAGWPKKHTDDGDDGGADGGGPRHSAL